MLFAQKDTVWQVANNVYIEAPVNANRSTCYYCGPGCSGSEEGANFIATSFDWETKTHEYRVSVNYSTHPTGSLRLMKKANDLEKIPWLKEGMKCEIIGTELKKRDIGGVAFLYSSYDETLTDNRYDSTKHERINGKYYYLDVRDSEWLFNGVTTAQILDGNKAEPERIVRRFLGIIPYYHYKKGSTYRADFRRLILVDSILYTFSMIAKKTIRGKKRRIPSKKRRDKHLDKHQPFFNDFVSGIIIREEEEEKPNED